MEKAQDKQKTWYDQKARELKLRTGDLVLILLPTSTEKMLCKWKGPFKIIRPVGKVNYEVEITEPRYRVKIFHVNKVERTRAGRTHSELSIGRTRGNSLLPKRTARDIRRHLWRRADPNRQMKTLIRKFRTVTNQEPGRTSLVKHKIITNNMPAIRQRQRRMAPDKKREVMEELKALLETGIVEESSSAWAYPIVMVAKKDGRNRICVDYRKLNAESKFDAYPMPRIDEMLDTIGRARYLTTIDLAKGYWQVPMEPEDREKTAFTSPLGLLQFTVCPSD